MTRKLDFSCSNKQKDKQTNRKRKKKTKEELKRKLTGEKECSNAEKKPI
jgi:hypothetical protein